MSWSWSHSPEAYEEWYAALRKKPLDWLKECLAEIRAKEPRHEDDDGTMFGFELNLVKYEEELKELTELCRSHKESGILTITIKEALAEEIWEFAQEQRTTDNGGYSAWMCPFGCHRIDA